MRRPNGGERVLMPRASLYTQPNDALQVTPGSLRAAGVSLFFQAAFSFLVPGAAIRAPAALGNGEECGLPLTARDTVEAA